VNCHVFFNVTLKLQKFTKWLSDVSALFNQSPLLRLSLTPNVRNKNDQNTPFPKIYLFLKENRKKKVKKKTD
jgi:hypothetical protein